MEDWDITKGAKEIDSESCGKALVVRVVCFGYSLRTSPGPPHSALSVAPAGPTLLHMPTGQKSAQSEPQAALPPARFDGRKAASPGPFLVSSGPQQARISDLF